MEEDDQNPDFVIDDENAAAADDEADDAAGADGDHHMDSDGDNQAEPNTLTSAYDDKNFFDPAAVARCDSLLQKSTR